MHKVVSICASSRFHYQHLAYQLLSHEYLKTWHTSLPLSKLPNDLHSFVRSHPSSIHLYYLASRFFTYPPGLNANLVYISNKIFDLQCSKAIESDLPFIDGVIGLSHHIFRAGHMAQKSGKVFFCDAPIAHPLYLNHVLAEEYGKLLLTQKTISEKQIRMESQAHLLADAIVVPSSFVKDTFIENGVPTGKIQIIPYGSSQFVSVETLSKSLSYEFPNNSSDIFRVLFVGTLSVRKGINYLLDAFAKFDHPRKELVLAGPLLDESREILKKYDLNCVKIMGRCTKATLETLFRNSSILVLPSLAEGLALVIGESLSYGLPVVYTYPTGGSDVLTEGKDGIMIKTACSSSIVDAFHLLCDDRPLLDEMRQNALLKSKQLCGWDRYGKAWISLIERNCSQ